MLLLNDLTLTIKHENDEQADAILSQLKACSGREHRIIHYDANHGQHITLPFILALHDFDGELAAGLVASSAWRAMFIRDLWVRPDLRARGEIIADLTRLAEAEAHERGCALLWAETHSYMTRSVYEKLGFRVVGETDNHPPGQAVYTLRKDLKANHHV